MNYNKQTCVEKLRSKAYRQGMLNNIIDRLKTIHKWSNGKCYYVAKKIVEDSCRKMLFEHLTDDEYEKIEKKEKNIGRLLTTDEIIFIMDHCENNKPVLEDTNKPIESTKTITITITVPENMIHYS